MDGYGIKRVVDVYLILFIDDIITSALKIDFAIDKTVDLYELDNFFKHLKKCRRYQISNRGKSQF